MHDDLLPNLAAIMLRLPVFALVAGRLGGLIMFLPVLSGRALPVRVRAILVIGLAALVAPFVSLPADAPDNLASLALAIGSEFLLGVLIGLVLRAVFIGLEIAGQMIAQQAGLAFGRVADPTTGEDTSILSTFYVQIGVVVFLLLGGHRVLVGAALDTFRSLPLLTTTDAFLSGTDGLFDALALGAALAVRIAAPVILTLFLVNVAMGFVARTVPQINIITLGFSIKGPLAFLIMAVSLPIAVDAFGGALVDAIEWIGGLLHGLAP
jgi:flagellar biosynthetic protein FliR